MEEHDNWKLGDEGEATPCERCGKRNRAGLTHCVICGTRLGDELEADPGSLRTIGAAMGGERRGRRGAPPRRSLRAWSISAGLLLLMVVVLTWLQTREEPFRLEDWTAPTPPPATRALVATPVGTQVIVPTRRPVAPAVVPPVMQTTPSPAPRPAATARVVAPARRVIASTIATPNRVPATEPVDLPTPVERPRTEATERPSLGTDLQDATRAYRQAVDLHNDRVDEYNAIADEIQRRNAWDDSAASVELRRRLDRAREGVEIARVYTETLRVRMESVQARYR